ncbi:MAG TPA: hypothetical protein VM840_04450 [Actinomycetota bacterium]|nr:hypothetical protein [Actinomycetota bacterium]
MSDPVAVVPVRTVAPKQRLASVLSAADRGRLTVVLASHVVGCLLEAGLETLVLCLGELDIGHRIEVVRDEGPTINGALDRLIASLGRPVLVVAADLPYATARSVEEVLAEQGDVVVARTADGGTGALLMRRPVRTAFGPRSALAHAWLAHQERLRTRVVEVDGLDRDLDDRAALTSAIARAPALRGWSLDGGARPPSPLA